MHLEKMMPQASPWKDYWDQDEFWSGSDIWDLNTRVFLKNMAPKLRLSPEDAVLNIGCGIGSLEEVLAPQVQQILSIDTSPRFAFLCAQKTLALENVAVKVLGEDYPSLEDIDQKFSLFLCISVIQYFRNDQEIKDLLRSCSKLALPGARLLLGDLHIEKSFGSQVFDLFRIVFSSLKEGYFLSLLRITARFFKYGGTYQKFRSENPELSLNREKLFEMIEELGLQASWIEEAVSIHQGRPSLLVIFPGTEDPTR